MKKYLNFILIIIFTIILIGCEDMNGNTFNPDKDLDLENIFFDDFNHGINKNDWVIGHEKWGIGNGGVIHENVNYTEDGVVILQSNGDYYDGPLKGIGNDHGRRTGSMIKTKKALGPGRYEVRMKVLPRFGSTTAMWTYYYESGLNQEIDIELNIQNTFKAMMTTNWYTLTEYTSKTNHIETVLNDFEWHTFRFDWRTDPKRIDYYLDDVLISTQTSNVPIYAGEFNIGNWFPDAWAGVPDFETDYTYVDWFKYTPFKNQEYIKTPDNESSPNHYYPSSPVSYPVANLISNAGFETTNNNAWRFDVLGNVEYIEEEGLDNSNALYIPKDEIAYQMITGIDESFELTFIGNAKLPNDGSGYVLFEFFPDETVKIDQYLLEFKSTDENFKPNEYYQKETTFMVPEGTKRIELSLIGNESEIYFDDLFMNLSKKPRPTTNSNNDNNNTNQNFDFYDDFTNGIDSEIWSIVNRKWGGNNGGVIYQNVNYTNEGILVLQANGDYYDGPLKGINQNHGKRTGAALRTIKNYGPGKYEVKAKALPRFGATTAFWTYYYEDGINSEIDIELNVNNDFRSIWFTNWLTETDYTSHKTTTPILHNDGLWHTYTFEWHIEPVPKIDYYIDGVLYHTEYEKVPTLGAHFWVGVWFPDNWAGNPNFETDYLLIDYVGINEFKDQSYQKRPDSSESIPSYYPVNPISLPQANLISNGNLNNALGYTLEDATIINNTLSISNGKATQLISGMDESLNLIFKSSIKGINSLVKFHFLNFEGHLIETKDISFNNLSNTTFKDIEKEIKVPKNSKSLLIEFSGTNSNYKEIFLNIESRINN